MAAKTPAKVSWTFPSRSVFFMKIEVVTVAIIALVVFFVTFSQAGKGFLLSTVLTVAFVILYGIISYLIQQLRTVEERYTVTKTHFHVTRKTKRKTRKEKVHLKKVLHHKLDKVFLGGYLISEEGKHLLFFNTKDELEKFERFVKKHSKPARRKKR